MKNKIVCFVMAGLMAVALVACGGKGNTTDDVGKDSEQESG